MLALPFFPHPHPNPRTKKKKAGRLSRINGSGRHGGGGGQSKYWKLEIVILKYFTPPPPLYRESSCDQQSRSAAVSFNSTDENIESSEGPDKMGNGLRQRAACHLLNATCFRMNRRKTLEENVMETPLRRCLSTLDITLLGIYRQFFNKIFEQLFSSSYDQKSTDKDLAIS